MTTRCYTFGRTLEEAASQMLYDDIDSAVKGAELWMCKARSGVKVYIFTMRSGSLIKTDLFIEKS